jgi:hypothetical protein
LRFVKQEREKVREKEGEIQIGRKSRESSNYCQREQRKS